MQVGTTAAFGTVGDVPVFVQRAPRVAGDEWTAFWQLLRGRAEVPVLLLVSVADGTIDAGQRHDLRRLVVRHGTRIAAMLDPKHARGLVTAMGWFGVEVGDFANDDLQGALAHLDRAAQKSAVAAVLQPLSVDPPRRQTAS